MSDKYKNVKKKMRSAKHRRDFLMSVIRPNVKISIQPDIKIRGWPDHYLAGYHNQYLAGYKKFSILPDIKILHPAG